MDLYIIGAGDVGGFIAYHANQMGKYTIKGFLDDNQKKHGKSLFTYKVLGGLNYLDNLISETAVAIAIANPVSKQMVYNKIKENTNIVFPNFIHPSAWLGKQVKFGKGCIVYPGVTFNFETVLNNFVIVNMNATIGHNCEFGNYSTVSPGVNCGGFTKLGELSFLGIGSCTIQSTKVGKNSIVGAGAVVIKDVPENAVMAGVPAKVIKIKQ